MDVALEGAGAGVALHTADRSPRAASRPFGPLPRGVVAAYGFLLAGAGLILLCLAGRLNGFGAAGANALVLGVGCIVLAVRAGRPPLASSFDAEDEPADTQVVAARIVTELADLERQLDELTEQCATFEPQWIDEDPGTPTRADEDPGTPVVMAPRARARAGRKRPDSGADAA